MRRHYLSHRQSGLIRFERALRVRPSYFPNSSIKGDGASVFLSGRDHPYYLDFHTPTKFLSETFQSPGRSGMPTTWGQPSRASPSATGSMPTSSANGCRAFETRPQQLYRHSSPLKAAPKETPNKLLISRKWTAWVCRKTRFSAAHYWITKAKPWLSALMGAPLPQQAIIACAPSTDSTGQTAWSVAPCSWPTHESGFSHNRIGA